MATTVAAPPPYYAARMAVFYAGYLSVNGIYLPFFPVWLENRGLTPVEIAICLTLPIFTRVIGTPWASGFADRAPNRRYAIRVFTFLGLFFFAFAEVSTGFWPILAVTGLTFLFWNMALPAAEALALTGVRRFGLDYGRMRLFGSAAFIIANLAGGAVVAATSQSVVFWLQLLTFAVSAAVSLTLPVTPRAVRALDDATRPSARPGVRIFRDVGFVAMILAASLIQASHAQIYGFGSIHWQDRGFSPTAIGLLWAIGVVAEILLFTFASRLGGFISAHGLLVVGAGAALARWLVFSLEPGLPVTFLLQVLHSLSFGAAFIGMQRVIAERIDESGTVAAQSFQVVAGAVAMAVLTLASGPLYRALGVDSFLVMAVPAGIALAILVVYRPRPIEPRP